MRVKGKKYAYVFSGVPGLKRQGRGSLGHNEEFGGKGILGQPPRKLSENSNFFSNQGIFKK